MSRTFRKKRKSDEIIRDGERQYAASSCRHHGGCSYCEDNRTFERFPSFQQEIQLLMDDLTENCSQSADISSEHIKDIDTLAHLWNVTPDKINFSYCAPVDEICIYLEGKWVGYFDENPVFYDSEKRLFILLGDGRYKYIEEENLYPAYSPLYGSIKDHHEWMRKRDEILLSRGQNLQTGYTVQGTTQEEIFKELTDLQNQIRKQQGLDSQGV